MEIYLLMNRLLLYDFFLLKIYEQFQEQIIVLCTFE